MLRFEKFALVAPPNFLRDNRVTGAVGIKVAITDLKSAGFKHVQ